MHRAGYTTISWDSPSKRESERCCSSRVVFAVALAIVVAVAACVAASARGHQLPTTGVTSGGLRPQVKQEVPPPASPGKPQPAVGVVAFPAGAPSVIAAAPEAPTAPAAPEAPATPEAMAAPAAPEAPAALPAAPDSPPAAPPATPPAAPPQEAPAPPAESAAPSAASDAPPAAPDAPPADPPVDPVAPAAEEAAPAAPEDQPAVASENVPPAAAAADAPAEDAPPVEEMDPEELKATEGCSDLVGPLPQKLWSSAPIDKSIQVKVLSYNLFWWNLFQLRKGNDGSAGKLIKENSADRAFDVMGFQECEDINWVMRDAGMTTRYGTTEGDHAICVAWLTERWTLVTQGFVDVAEDQPGLYGTRAVQWVRLKHSTSGKFLFFLNHHGPLPVDTGGECGGKVVGSNIIRVITASAMPGDAIIVVGDFNAAPGSDTVMTLSKYLTHIFNGAMCGGIDNILSNTAASSVIGTSNLGDGGSDHDAISSIIEVGNADAMPADGPASVGEGKHTTPPPAGGEDCKCQCKWADSPGACDASSVDNSCCWQQCCMKVGIAPANSDHTDLSECKCAWARPATCEGPSDGTPCHDKCCADIQDGGAEGEEGQEDEEGEEGQEDEEGGDSEEYEDEEGGEDGDEPSVEDM